MLVENRRITILASKEVICHLVLIIATCCKKRDLFFSFQLAMSGKQKINFSEMTKKRLLPTTEGQQTCFCSKVFSINQFRKEPAQKCFPLPSNQVQQEGNSAGTMYSMAPPWPKAFQKFASEHWKKLALQQRAVQGNELSPWNLVVCEFLQAL